MLLYCKNCGTELNITNDKNVVVCEFCGMEQTIPKANDPQKIQLFVQANEKRMGCCFDVAKKQYEKIIEQFPDDNEAYWCKLLCEYGIEYVDDIATEKKIPTCHRTIKQSIFDNKDYKFIIERATAEEKAIYEAEAKEIDRLQKEIKAKAEKSENFDIFICYKDSDENNRRSIDSQYANKIYTHFVNQGYKVFFSRVTLKNMAGAEYEPIIYSALSSAKVMLLVCANKAYINAPWVRNEWSRFLEFMHEDYTKVLVPCLKDVYPYDLPEELAKVQVMDMSDIDFYENLLRQVNSKFGKIDTVSPTRTEENATNNYGFTQSDLDIGENMIKFYLRRLDVFL